MSLLDTASLIVTPNGYKEGKLYSVIPSDGSGDLSVTRATTATRVNSAGLVELVPYNLLQYSEQFDNAAWTKVIVNVTSNATTAPNGTLTADKLIALSANTQHRLDTTTVGNQNSFYTFSVYAKAAEYKYISLRTANNSICSYDLLSGVIVATGVGCTPTIENVGDGWYRCAVTQQYTGSTTFANRINVLDNTANNTFTGDNVSGVYLWGAQLVEGSTAKDYQKTETRLNIPRLDYSNGTCPSLLVEPQRTNLLTYSSSFDNAAWIKSSGGTGSLPVITPNTTISPSGVQDADTIVLNSGAGTTPSDQSQFYQLMSVVSGTKYTMTFYAKGVTGGEQIMVKHAGAGSYTKITLTNEWARYSVTETAVFTGVVTPAFLIRRGLLEPINASATFYLWGVQIEVGSYATSYIPTTSASVTRNADVISKTGISSLIGQTEGTIFVDAYLTGKNSSNGSILFATDKTSTSAFIRIVYTQLDSLRFDVFDGSSFQCILSAGPYNVGDRVKVAGGYKNNDFVMYVNGTQIGTDTSGSVPATDTANINTHIFGDTNGSFVNAAALWKTRLTNTQLAQLTSI